MAFRTIPTTIKDAQKDLKAINDNFEQTYQDLIDQGGLKTGVASLDNTVVAGGAYRISVTLVDSDLARRQIYVPNRVIMIPRLDVYIDVDDDESYLWPSGGSLSADQYADIEVSIHVSRTKATTVTDGVATLRIHIKNHDTADHDFFVSTDAFVFPSVPTSRFT